MLNEFVDFTQNLFPSINPYVQSQTKKSLEQFKKHQKYNDFLTNIPYAYLSQGDIFENVPFIQIKDDGGIGATRQKGMLLSNTCSAENDDDIVMAPLFKISDLGLKLNNVSDNCNFHLMYIPDEMYKDYVVDFSRLNSFNKELLSNMIKEGKIFKEASLNQFGYYFLLCKLTINFMRPEDAGVQEERKTNYFSLYTS